jgi:FemAB family
MLVTDNRYLLFEERQIWWPERPEDVFPLLSRAPVVTAMQCTDSVASALEPYAFRRRPFDTLLINLSRSEAELWSGLDAKSCRQPIRRVQEIGCRVLMNGDQERALEFINAFVRRRRFRRPISSAEWRRDLQHADVFTAMHEDRMLAAHLVLVDPPFRARVLLGGTARLEGGVQHTLMGGVNRYLHWFELNHYRGEGIAWYDFGGIEQDRASPQYSITRFKLSFGGAVVRQNIVRLTASRGLRLGLRQLARAKLGIERARRLWQTKVAAGALARSLGAEGKLASMIAHAIPEIRRGPRA